MRLAVQEQLVPGRTLKEKYEFAVTAGFDAIELRGAGNFGFRDRLPELREARDAGVIMPTVCVEMRHFIGQFDPELRRDAIDNMKSQISVIVEVGGQGAGAGTPAAWAMYSRRLRPFEPPPRTPEEDRKVLLDALHELGEHARQEGGRVLLEPLNRYEDHMVNTLAQATELVGAVALDSVKVVGDLFHMNIEEDDLAASIHAAAGQLAHVQVSDSNRLQPGTGHLDWRTALGALHDVGYAGYLAMECRLRGDPTKVLPEAARFLRAQLAAVQGST